MTVSLKLRMRFKITLQTSPFTFPRDYRRYFISFLKNIFATEEVYEDLYGDKKFKPFTFSVWLGEDFEIEEREMKSGEKISVLFSSGDPKVLTTFYNGVIELKKEKKEIVLGEGRLTIGDITLLPQRRILSNKVLFKTVGISVLTDPDVSAKDFKNWYLLPGDNLERFNRVLRERTNFRYKWTTGEERNFSLSFVPLTESEFQILKAGCLVGPEFDTPIKETVVEHYEGYVRGFRGVFWLTGEPAILQFVYDYGFGVRTGQGFGLVDIIVQS